MQGEEEQMKKKRKYTKTKALSKPAKAQLAHRMRQARDKYLAAYAQSSAAWTAHQDTLEMARRLQSVATDRRVKWLEARTKWKKA